MGGVIRVLIVDDSAFVRKVVRQMLSRSPFIEVVGAAHDGEDALELAEQLKPDVITLDMNMPRLGGLEFLRKQMARHPIPVIVLSIASESGELVVQALDAGAVDVVQKPTSLASEQILSIAEDLIEKVKSAAVSKVRATHAGTATPIEVPALRTRRTDILVIGVSTGGPQALKQLIPKLPSDFPIPIAIVLHMPVGYTELFAQSLALTSRLAVAEARDGDLVRPGLVHLAPAGYHLSFNWRPDGKIATRLSLRPLNTPHRPAVDVLFRSAAETYGERVLAVVLTGMGSDGTEGSGWVKSQGGRVLTEAEETCVVYGMPRSVAEAGLSDASIPLTDMARAIIEEL